MTRLTGRISSFILCLAIGGAPLPFGSRDAVTVAVWVSVLGLGLVFASLRQLRRGHFLVLGGIGLIIACYGFVLHEQLADYPWIASPNPIWAKTSKLLGQPIPPSVSIIRGEPFYALGPQLANVLVLTLGLIVGTDRDRARQALHVMAWAGVGYAVYGIADLLLDPTAILWRTKVFNTESVTATFINRNTAAAYFGSCAAAWLIMLMARIRGKLPAGPIVWSKLARNAGSGALSDKQIVVRFFMFFVCLAAMLMTQSRGGILFSVFAMAIASVVFLRRDLPGILRLGVALVSAGAVALTLLQFFGGNVASRIEAGGLVEQGRLAAYKSTLRIIADYPWFGTGLGTFTTIFPAYRSGNISILGIWNVAHSTPLELAVELGIPLTLVIVAGWIAALAVLVHGTGRSRRDTVVPLVALAVSLIGLLHTSIDFSLQVSGYAIVVFGLAGVGLGQSFAADPVHRHRRRRSELVNDETKDPENGFGKRAVAVRGETDPSEGKPSGLADYIRSWFAPRD